MGWVRVLSCRWMVLGWRVLWLRGLWLETPLRMTCPHQQRFWWTRLLFGELLHVTFALLCDCRLFSLVANSVLSCWVFLVLSNWTSSAVLPMATTLLFLSLIGWKSSRFFQLISWDWIWGCSVFVRVIGIFTLDSLLDVLWSTFASDTSSVVWSLFARLVLRWTATATRIRCDKIIIGARLRRRGS